MLLSSWVLWVELKICPHLLWFVHIISPLAKEKVSLASGPKERSLTVGDAKVRNMIVFLFTHIAG